MNFIKIEEILNEKIISIEPLGGGCIACTNKIITAPGINLVVKQANGNVCQKEANGLMESKKKWNNSNTKDNIY